MPRIAKAASDKNRLQIVRVRYAIYSIPDSADRFLHKSINMQENSDRLKDQFLIIKRLDRA